MNIPELLELNLTSKTAVFETYAAKEISFILYLRLKYWQWKPCFEKHTNSYNLGTKKDERKFYRSSVCVFSWLFGSIKLTVMRPDINPLKGHSYAI